MPVLICPRKKIWTRSYSTRDQVPVCPVFTRAKIKSRFGILKNFPSQYIFNIYDEGHWHAHTRRLSWGLPEVVETVQQVHCSWRRWLRRGLKFHVCTINKSFHTKKSGNVFNDPIEEILYTLTQDDFHIYIYIYIYYLSNKQN